LLHVKHNDDGYNVDDEALQIGYRRPKILTALNTQDELSDYAKFRLWLARQLALKKYQETWV